MSDRSSSPSKADRLRARTLFYKSYVQNNRKTVWAACRAVILSTVLISMGITMAVLGYFDRQLGDSLVGPSSNGTSTANKVVLYHLKSMQYVGPVLMGIGAVLLIIACVITLESRDRHAQVIEAESAEARQRRLLLAESQELDAEEETAPSSRAEPVPKSKRNSKLITLVLPDDDKEAAVTKVVLPGASDTARSLPASIHKHVIILPDALKQAPMATLDSITDLNRELSVSESTSPRPSLLDTKRSS